MISYKINQTAYSSFSIDKKNSKEDNTIHIIIWVLIIFITLVYCITSIPFYYKVRPYYPWILFWMGPFLYLHYLFCRKGWENERDNQQNNDRRQENGRNQENNVSLMHIELQKYSRSHHIISNRENLNSNINESRGYMNALNEREDWAFCLDTMNIFTQNIRTLQWNHKFHFSWFEEYKRRNARSNMVPCPLCRKEVRI